MIPRHRFAAVVALLLLVTACSAPAPGSTGSTGSTGAPGSLTPVPSTGSPATGTCSATPPPQGTPEGWDVSTQRPSIFPQLINPSGSIACGSTRLMFSFLDKENVPIATPERTVQVKLFDLGADPATAAIEGAATFIWAIEPTVGVYVIDAAFPTSGTWGAEFTTAAGGAGPETIRVTFEVQPEPAVVSVGDPAPASDTPTLADVDGDVARISTDSEPVEAFYETSIADAVAAKEPFVVVFATPRFCATAQCGPTLERIKPIAAAHPDLTVINVEPYKLELQDGALQPVLTNDKLTPAPATVDWKLLAEPWVFVVDRGGTISASFMLIFSDEELEAAIAAVE